MAQVRLQKIIAQAGITSRRKAEELIRQGLVQVNGQVVTTLGATADPEVDYVRVEGKLVRPRPAENYVLLNKPRGYLTSAEQTDDRPTVFALLKPGKARLFPVGRLDYDAEGLLLLTDDGELAQRLTHPRYEVSRTYHVKVRGRPQESALEHLRKGVRLADGVSRAKVRVLPSRSKQHAWLEIVLREGRHREVKRMCEAVGHPVLKLKRVAFAGLTLSGLPVGASRPLTPKEVERLKRAGFSRNGRRFRPRDERRARGTHRQSVSRSRR